MGRVALMISPFRRCEERLFRDPLGSAEGPENIDRLFNLKLMAIYMLRRSWRDAQSACILNSNISAAKTALESGA